MPPTLLSIMVRPRWILALLFALAIAGGFAWLGHWQLERAIASGHVTERSTETSKPLQAVVKPAMSVPENVVGQLVTARVTFVPGDYHVLEGRLNQGVSAYWVVGHATTSATSSATATSAPSASGPAELAVARGWAPTKAAAEAAIRTLAQQPAVPATISGRLLATEAPEVPDPHGDPNVMKTMSVAALDNLWHGVDGHDVYSAYLVERNPPAGLTAIYAPRPEVQATINWLNIFYAAEWAIFAGFAIFFWYRLVKDAQEREEEELAELQAAEGSAEASARGPGGAGGVAAGPAGTVRTQVGPTQGK